MQQRLHAVCDLLGRGTVPNEAYLLCGFRDYANFYRAFRRAHTGRAPGICSGPPESGGGTRVTRCIEKSPQRFLTALSEL
ncbi:MAG: hypothetical protein ACLSTW_06770 [Faecalibacterium sp.]